MISNYIFDFGNVLAQFSPDKLTAPYVTDEKVRKYISEIVFDRKYWDKLDRGTITDDEVKAEISRRIPADMQEVALKVYDNWIENLIPVKNMERLIFDIHKTNKRLYLLSDISIGFAKRYRDVEWVKKLFECFDGLVFSGVVGIVKPNKEIFEYLLTLYDLKADECLFVDDNLNNIEGAKAVGISGYLFDGDAIKLRNYLRI
ncbi:MAG: HAD family phosphatase [Clostridia bacterium]|nr:HAD family phosphatase [Clostridia bacterium]